MDVTSCKKKMYEGEIKALVERNGFSLQKEIKIKNMLYTSGLEKSRIASCSRFYLARFRHKTR